MVIIIFVLIYFYWTGYIIFSNYNYVFYKQTQRYFSFYHKGFVFNPALIQYHFIKVINYKNNDFVVFFTHSNFGIKNNCFKVSPTDFKLDPRAQYAIIYKLSNLNLDKSVLRNNHKYHKQAVKWGNLAVQLYFESLKKSE